MRARKVVLLVDANPEWLSIWTMVLETRVYRVLPAASAYEALKLLEVGTVVDVIVAELMLGGGMNGSEMLRLARIESADLPVLLFSRSVQADSASVKLVPKDVGRTIFLPKAMVTPAVMIERVRLLVVRKRGPKKRAVVQAVAAVCDGLEGAA